MVNSTFDGRRIYKLNVRIITLIAVIIENLHRKKKTRPGDDSLRESFFLHRQILCIKVVFP